MQLVIPIIVWAGVAVDGFTDFGVGLGIGMTLGVLIQWDYKNYRK